MVKRGVDDAAARTGVTVNYSAPATFDMVQMWQLIDAAVAKNPDGLVVSVPDYDALKDSLAAATDAGIPIITINSGSDVYQEIGAITHVGQDETVAGEGAGAQLAEAGATNVICINQEVGNAGLDARCAGARTAIEEAGGTLEVVQVDLNDAAGAQSTISSALQADDDIDAVLALGPTGAAPALAAIEELGRPATSSWPRSTSAPRCSTPSTATCCSPSTSSSTCRATCRSCSSRCTQQPQHRRRRPAVLTGPGFVTPTTPSRSASSPRRAPADLTDDRGGGRRVRHRRHDQCDGHRGTTMGALTWRP